MERQVSLWINGCWKKCVCATHRDKDLTYLAVTVQWREGWGVGICKDMNRILVYLTFPLLGRAVLLSVGDILFIFDDIIYCVLLYLKSGVTGLHNNSIER